MLATQKNGPAGARDSGTDQNSSSCGGAKNNPFRLAWLGQEKNPEPSAEPPHKPGRPVAVRERQRKLLVDRIVMDAILSEAIRPGSEDLATLLTNMRERYKATTRGGWLLMPTPLEGGEVSPWTTPRPYDEPAIQAGEPLVSEDAVRSSNPDEAELGRNIDIGRLEEWNASFPRRVLDRGIYRYSLGDEQNLLNRLRVIRESIGRLRVRDGQNSDKIAGQVDALLAEMGQLAVNDELETWDAGRHVKGSAYQQGRERFGQERQAIADARMQRLQTYEDEERAFLDGLDWSDDEPPQPPASPDGDGPAPAGQPTADNAAAAPEPVASQAVTVSTTPGPVEHDDHSGQSPFPTDAFPPRMAEYCRRVSEAHVVDESLPGLAMLAVAGAAMGNACRLALKTRFPVPPLLWVAVVARSGSNKTAPLNDVVQPLRAPVPIEAIRDAILTPQGRIVVSNATVEAVIARLAENPRGQLSYCNELAGWVKGFNAYKKSGGDEQAWLEFWDAKPYTLDRKTNNEHVHIPAASVSVLGGIQPVIFAQCFDPSKFASGLVPRMLVTMPDKRRILWTEAFISDDAQAVWADVIVWLRTRPFSGLDPDTGRYLPHVLTLTSEAKAEYIRFYNSVDDFIAGAGSEHADAFAAKAREMAGRIALILQGMIFATGCRRMAGQVDIQALTGGVRIAQWCLAEQLRVFGLSSRRFVSRREDEVAAWMRTRGGRSTVRELHQSHSKRYENRDQVQADLDRLVASGKARWEGKACVLLE